MNRQSNDPDRIAQSAVLAMLLELSSSPKPGNVDRCHDFSDIGFHHFLASAISSYPVFRQAAAGTAEAAGTCRNSPEKGKFEGEAPSRKYTDISGTDASAVGFLIFQAVSAWQDWNLLSNTHFGSITLMMPLALAAARSGDLREEVCQVLAGTTVADAIEFYKAFRLAGARVKDVQKFSLNDDGWQESLRMSGKTLLDLMRLSCGHDLIAREWSSGYERTFLLADRIDEQTKQWGINDGVVRVFLQALWEEPDSLICAKFGADTARQVSEMAGSAFFDKTLKTARELDADLLEKDINPGSTADLIAAALFISLLRGLRF